MSNLSQVVEKIVNYFRPIGMECDEGDGANEGAQMVAYKKWDKILQDWIDYYTENFPEKQPPLGANERPLYPPLLNPTTCPKCKGTKVIKEMKDVEKKSVDGNGKVRKDDKGKTIMDTFQEEVEVKCPDCKGTGKSEKHKHLTEYEEDMMKLFSAAMREGMKPIKLQKNMNGILREIREGWGARLRENGRIKAR
jgi:hypothetical protein